MSTYTKNRGGVFNLKYHIVWCPKFRNKLLRGLYARTLKVFLEQKAQEIKVNIEALEIMPDHVHLFVSVRPTDCPAKLANLFKGYTSFMMRKRFPGLAKRFKVFWSPSYYIGSVGHVSEETVKRYIAAQND